ncbi:MAG: hypothetical protein DYG98_05775 [Haliscomenobacteraceae bacterium CHB4]|nr:hypothetical protein [Haliscomenobacteraceae bacterium CHB4]
MLFCGGAGKKFWENFLPAPPQKSIYKINCVNKFWAKVGWLNENLPIDLPVIAFLCGPALETAFFALLLHHPKPFP